MKKLILLLLLSTSSAFAQSLELKVMSDIPSGSQLSFSNDLAFGARHSEIVLTGASADYFCKVRLSLVDDANAYVLSAGDPLDVVGISTVFGNPNDGAFTGDQTIVSLSSKKLPSAGIKVSCSKRGRDLDSNQLLVEDFLSLTGAKIEQIAAPVKL